MAIAFPLAFPARGPSRITFAHRNVVGLQESSISLVQTVYDFGGDGWVGEIEWGPQKLDTGYDIIGFLASLRGHLGTFLLGDPLMATPRGTWAGTPLLNGIHAANARTLTVDGFSAGATVKRGDYLQFGSGATTRLHQVLADATANGSGQATLEVFPRLRVQYADNTALVKTATQGLWRLGSTETRWTLEDIRVYGITVPIVEALEL